MVGGQLTSQTLVWTFSLKLEDTATTTQIKYFFQPVCNKIKKSRVKSPILLTCLLVLNPHTVWYHQQCKLEFTFTKKRKARIFFSVWVWITFRSTSAKIRGVEKASCFRKCFYLTSSVNVAISIDISLSFFWYLPQLEDIGFFFFFFSKSLFTFLYSFCYNMVCILLSCTVYLQDWKVAQKMPSVFWLVLWVFLFFFFFEFYIKSFPSPLKDVLAVLFTNTLFFPSLFEVKKYGLIRGQQLYKKDCSMLN